MFDLDGTLVDSVPDLTVALNHMLEEVPLASVTENQVRAWVGNGAVRLVERALTHCEKVTDADVLPSFVDRFKYYYGQHAAVKTRLYSGVLPLLQYLRDHQIPMAIVTNKPREFVPAILSSLFVDHFFSHIIGGNDFARCKPAPDQLLACLEKFQCDPQYAMMIGDSRNDIQAARQAKVPVVAVDYGYNHGQPIVAEKPDRVVSALTELIR